MAAFTLLDTGTFADGHPHAAYDRLRAEAPVYRDPGSPTQPPVHLLTRHEDIRRVSLDGANFTSTRGFRIATDRRAAMDPEIARTLSRFMLAMDDPEHAAFRGLVANAFLPSALARLEPRIRASVDRLLNSLEGESEVDFVNDVGAKVPIQTICAIMGVPEEDEWRVFEFTNAVFGTDDPDYAPSLEVANERYLAIFDYGWHLLEDRRRNPRDDLLTIIATARVDGRPLDRTEQVSFFSNMIAAGNETTRSSLAGAIWALHIHPQERSRIVADPGCLRHGVQELLRWVSPVFHMARTATHDIEIAGTPILAGERVAMLYGAGNHDPALFDDPHRLWLDRPNANRHLGFGHGIHHCLGARLALMQLRILLEALLPAFPDYEVLEKPAYIRSSFVAAMKALPIRLRR